MQNNNIATTAEVFIYSVLHLMMAIETDYV
jgi:hypothetical protein